MSYSGAGLYDDDAGADARSRYREMVADGMRGEEATDALVAEWGAALDDHDGACAFWLALADTQWRVGRLEDRVRDRAVALIENGEDLARFGHNRRLQERRRVILEKLDAQLASPQRPPTRLRKPFRSQSPVKVGDVFWVALPSGRRSLMRCVALNGDERDNYPTVEVLDWNGDTAPSDPGALLARGSTREPWPDLLTLFRYPRDPDPSTQIQIIAEQTQVTRSRTVPAIFTPWTRLEEHLVRIFEEGVQV